MSRRECIFRIISLIVIFTLTVWWAAETYEVRAHESISTNIRVMPSRVAAPQPAYQTITMMVTGYSPTCRHCCGSWTELGEKRNQLGVAADYSLLPSGTRLYIPGIGHRVVDDTGGAMRESSRNGVYHIDVRFKSHRAAKRWDVKQLSVIVYNPPQP